MQMFGDSYFCTPRWEEWFAVLLGDFSCRCGEGRVPAMGNGCVAVV